ncbi:MAG: hypothetical protein ABI672_13370 [Vicinamibacteria bacterium]
MGLVYGLNVNDFAEVVSVADPRCKNSDHGLCDGDGRPPFRHSSRRRLRDDGARRRRRADCGRAESKHPYDLHNRLGRPTQVQGPDGTTTIIDYNQSSQRTAVRDALGNGTGYQYDRYGRVTTVSGVSGTALYTYDLMSNLTSLTDAKGQKTSLEYDTHDRVKKMIHPTALAKRRSSNRSLERTRSRCQPRIFRETRGLMTVRSM